MRISHHAGRYHGVPSRSLVSLSNLAGAVRGVRGRTFVLVALLLLAGAGAARADFPGDVPDRFKFQAGGVDAQFVTQGSLSLTDGPVGAFLNFEDVFDLPISKSFWIAEGFYRFSEKGYVDFGYVDFRRTAGTILDQDINWGDHTFLANGEVDAKFATTFAYAAYRHDFLRLDQVHISGSAGFAYLRLGTGLSASGNVLDQNGDPVSGSFSQDVSVSFPVPLVGLQLDWKLTKHTAIQMYFRTLYVDASGFAGGIRESAIRYEWYATRHFAIGGGFDNYNISLRKYTTGDFTARFEYDVRGFEGYLKMAF